jgi:hypothetical protein
VMRLPSSINNYVDIICVVPPVRLQQMLQRLPDQISQYRWKNVMRYTTLIFFASVKWLPVKNMRLHSFLKLIVC